jgi:predicted ester cyclase
MSAEENKALVRRFMETRARADLNAIEGMLAPGFISHGSRPGHQPGREGYKRQLAEFVTAFSDVRFVIEDQVAQGDKVVSRISGRGTYDRKEIMSVAPTGREVSSMAIFIHRISGGKIAEEWGAGTGGSNIMGLRLEQERIARERIEQELEVARSIQQASLPEEVPQLEGWQLSPFYRPAREVGGDFYDFHLLSEGRLGVVVGDATGKGVPAALVMSTTLGMLQLAARALESPSPGEVLAQVNETLLSRIPQNMFVTCFYAVLDPESATLRYANAGHDPPYVRRSNHSAEELRARGMPLGLLAGMEYEEQGVSLSEGESVIFYSDGLVEAHDPRARCSAFPGSGSSLPSMVRSDLWRTS